MRSSLQRLSIEELLVARAARSLERLHRGPDVVTAPTPRRLGQLPARLLQLPCDTDPLLPAFRCPLPGIGYGVVEAAEQPPAQGDLVGQPLDRRRLLAGHSSLRPAELHHVKLDAMP